MDRYYILEQDSSTYYEENSTANVKVSLGNKSLFIWLLCFVQLYSYVALQDKRYDGHGSKKLNKKGPPCLLAVKNRNKKIYKVYDSSKPKLLSVIHALISLCVLVSVSKIKENRILIKSVWTFP